jgi:glycerol-3-phosphate acyltransferase PlsY
VAGGRIQAGASRHLSGIHEGISAASFPDRGWYVGGWGIVPVAVAPILGHAFSPFVGFKGGKAIAVSFGMWSAVTRFEGAIALAAILAFLSAAVKLGLRGKPVTSDMDGCQAVAGMLMLGGYLTLRAFPGYVILLCMCNLLVFA